MKNLSCLMHSFPPAAEQEMPCTPVFCSQAVNKCPFQGLLGATPFVFLLVILLFGMARSVVLKCWCLLK